MNEFSSEAATRSRRDAEGGLIIQSLARLDAFALGISVATVCGLATFLATNFLIFKGGDAIGQNLSLLKQYFIGYEVTPVGSLIGLFYGFVSGFILGWLTAFLRNGFIAVYIHLLKFKSGISAYNSFIDHP